MREWLVEITEVAVLMLNLMVLVVIVIGSVKALCLRSRLPLSIILIVRCIRRNGFGDATAGQILFFPARLTLLPNRFRLCRGEGFFHYPHMLREYFDKFLCDR